MIKDIISYLNDIDKKILKLIKYGLIFSSIICIFAIIILFTYLFFYQSIVVFFAGFSLLKLSIYLAVEFIICGFAIDIIIKKG